MYFRVLGPLEVHTAGRELPLGARKQRLVLALLALNANRVVSVEELIDELWAEAPPASAVANVRGYVGHLRRRFDSAEPSGDRLTRRGTGYLLRADTDELDLLEYLAHVSAGRGEVRRGRQKAAAARFGDALACWRGPMFAGLPRWRALAARCAAVEDERLEVTEELAALHLELGQSPAAIEALREQVRQYPLRERGRVVLMRALHRSGDTPAALTTFAEGRAAMREQLGIEPGPELRELHRAILTGEADAAPSGSSAAPDPVQPAPAQLPLDMYGFTGRVVELAQLDGVLAAAGDEPKAVVISAIAGTAGVGKTALAVHWAHQVRDRFPDGQLYVNLRGFDSTGVALTPAQAVRGFLDALAVPPKRVPADIGAQAALYRSLLTDRRMLLLLDNARDAEQVRPLFPGSPGCLVVITSRNQLTGLVAAEGARPVTLDMLTWADAHALLTSRLGAERVAAEPAATAEIIERCARLPLALAIVAASAAIRPAVSLAALAAALGDTRAALDMLTTGDAATDVRAVFSWSYRALSGPAARLFRLLGLHPGPDIGEAAAASLAGVSVVQVRHLLAELTRAHMATEQTPDRYSLHDLLAAYAAEQATAQDTEADRRAAMYRLLDHYLHTAYTAAMLLYPQRDPITLAAAQPGVVPEAPADHDAALAWFGVEHRVLVSAVHRSAETGFDVHAWQLTWTMWHFLGALGHWHDWIAILDTALDAARRLGDRYAEADAHSGLSGAYESLGLMEQAQAHAQRTLELSRDLGDHTEQGFAHLNLAHINESQERFTEALAESELALHFFHIAGHRVGQARALNSVGWLHSMRGDHEKALGYCQQAIELHEETDNRWGLASTLDSVGHAHQNLAQYDQAIASYERSLDLIREFGVRNYQGETLLRLGEAHQAIGNLDAARDAWRQALAIFTDLDHPNAEAARAKLSAVA